MSARIYQSEGARRAAEYQRAKARRPAASADPITALTETERAYIAGLLDGEGYLTIGRVGPRKVNYYPIVAVAITHLGVIEWLQMKLSVKTHFLNNHTRVRQGWKPQHMVRLHGKRAQLLCRAVLPFMIVKRGQAELITAFPAEARFGPGRPIPPDVQAERQRLHDEMRPLNRRGKVA